jgi:hypothetical protein
MTKRTPTALPRREGSPLDALLASLAVCGDGLVRQWADHLRRGDRTRPCVPPPCWPEGRRTLSEPETVTYLEQGGHR